MRTWIVCSLGLCALSCSTPAPIACHAVGQAQVVCGLQNPEDLAVIPADQDAQADQDTTQDAKQRAPRYLIASELGSIEDAPPGELSLLDTQTGKLTPLFPQGGVGTPPQIEEGPDWGDAHCPGPIDKRLNPHGIDLARRPDGKRVLYAVNHGGRESVELFELRGQGATLSLAWRGCVLAPKGMLLNDVAALPGGGFVATQMVPKGGALASLYWVVRAELGLATGRVLQWQPGRALRALPGTELAYPNGIQVSADGRELFIGAYLGNELVRVERATGKRLARVAIVGPDDITWSDDGRLLVSSNVGGMSAMSECLHSEGACGAAFAIYALDPKTLAKTELVRRQGAPMGAASVAVTLGQELFIGSFKSDRILRLPR